MTSERFLAPVPYGSRQAQTSLQQGAPTAGQPGTQSVLDTPRRARRGARRPQAGQGQAAPAPLPTPPVPYAVQVAQAWQAIAADPGASPLVRQYALEAGQASSAGSAIAP